MRVCWCLLCLLVVGCSAEHELLVSSGDAASVPDTALDSQVVDSQDNDSQANEDVSHDSPSSMDGPSEATADTAGNDSGAGEGGADACQDGACSAPCFVDEDCVLGSVCRSGKCAGCKTLTDAWDFCAVACVGGILKEVVKNGCSLCECSASTCEKHAQCPEYYLCASDGLCKNCLAAGDMCSVPCPSGYVQREYQINGCPRCGCEAM